MSCQRTRTIAAIIGPKIRTHTVAVCPFLPVWLNEPSEAANLSRFKSAILAVRSGTADAKILCIGDSTTAGVGTSTMTTIPATKAYPRILADLINSGLAVAAQGMGNPRRFGGDPDDRWTYGSGWGFGSYAWSSVESNSPAGALLYAPDGAAIFDGFEVFYLTAAVGLGLFTATATGGTPVAVNTNYGTQAINKSTVMCASAGIGKSLSITGVGGCYIVGVEPILSTDRRVRVANVGVPGATSGQWASAGGFNRLGAITAYAPDLTILSLGLNEADPSVLETNLNTIVAHAKTFGDVVLWPPPPPQGGSYPATMAAFQAKYAAVAAAQSIPLVDVYAQFGGVYNGSMMWDDLHPNDAGYAAIAAAIYDAIVAP